MTTTTFKNVVQVYRDNSILGLSLIEGLLMDGSISELLEVRLYFFLDKTEIAQLFDKFNQEVISNYQAILFEECNRLLKENKGTFQAVFLLRDTLGISLMEAKSLVENLKG